jgi:hypothetical protein
VTLQELALKCLKKPPRHVSSGGDHTGSSQAFVYTAWDGVIVPTIVEVATSEEARRAEASLRDAVLCLALATG